MPYSRHASVNSRIRSLPQQCGASNSVSPCVSYREKPSWCRVVRVMYFAPADFAAAASSFAQPAFGQKDLASAS